MVQSRERPIVQSNSTNSLVFVHDHFAGGSRLLRYERDMRPEHPAATGGEVEGDSGDDSDRGTDRRVSGNESAEFTKQHGREPADGGSAE